MFFWAWRMRLILAQDRPRLTGYDQDLWAERLHYDEAGPSDALELLTVLRRANLRLVDGASPADLKRGTTDLTDPSQNACEKS